MSNPKTPPNSEAVLEHLNKWREAIIPDLREPATHEAALELKRQLDHAIACLEFCARHQIRPNCQVTILPPTLTRTLSSEYRIMEDHETEGRGTWTEIQVGGREFRPSEDDIILSN